MRGPSGDPSDPSPLFDDTSSEVNNHGHGDMGKGPDAYPGQAFLSDPMSNLAMAYGSSLASHGKEMMDKNVCDSCQTSINDHELCDVHSIIYELGCVFVVV